MEGRWHDARTTRRLKTKRENENERRERRNFLWGLLAILLYKRHPNESFEEDVGGAVVAARAAAL